MNQPVKYGENGKIEIPPFHCYAEEVGEIV